MKRNKILLHMAGRNLLGGLMIERSQTQNGPYCMISVIWLNLEVKRKMQSRMTVMETEVTLGWQWESAELLKMSYILFGVIVVWVHQCVKTHWVMCALLMEVAPQQKVKGFLKNCLHWPANNTAAPVGRLLRCKSLGDRLSFFCPVLSQGWVLGTKRWSTRLPPLPPELSRVPLCASKSAESHLRGRKDQNDSTPRPTASFSALWPVTSAVSLFPSWTRPVVQTIPCTSCWAAAWLFIALVISPFLPPSAPLLGPLSPPPPTFRESGCVQPTRRRVGIVEAEFVDKYHRTQFLKCFWNILGHIVVGRGLPLLSWSLGLLRWPQLSLWLLDKVRWT